MAKKTHTEAEDILDFSEGEHHLTGEDDASPSRPERTCIVGRGKAARADLLRFVLSPSKDVIPDIKAVLPGRGVWTARKKTIVTEAVKRKAFNRAFRDQVNVRPDLADQVEELLKRSVLERLSLVKKSGSLVLGFAKIEEALRRGDIVGLVHASDAAPAGCSKLDRKFLAGSDLGNHTIDGKSLTSAEISLATGSANAIHAALKASGATSAFFDAVRSYSDYCAAE